jgi:hypothetical protein
VAGASPQVAQVLLAHSLQVRRQFRLHLERQHGDAVLVALSSSHHDVVAREVDVLDAQAATLEQPQTTAIQERRHQARTPLL